VHAPHPDRHKTRIESLRQALRDPATWPTPREQPDGAPEVIETHLSLVGLYGSVVYKLKKPIDLGFVDYTSIESRRRACRDEVRLNRRLAPEVYLGVVPLVRTSDGSLRLDGDGDVVDWAVKMRRLPDAWRMSDRLDRVSTQELGALGRLIARFHARAARNERISAFATPDAIAANARENFTQTRGHVGHLVHGSVWGRLRARTDALLMTHRELMASRVRHRRPCETHGDLRLEHVYLQPDGRMVVLDAVEFAERYRHADPVSDVAFLAMELHEAGRGGLAPTFVESWVRASNDTAAWTLMPFYLGYRAIVRAKVHGITALDTTRPDDVREAARARAQRLWLLAMGWLEVPRRRPLLLLVGGLPGVGKSTLSRALGRQLEARVLRSDVVRKKLAGLEPHQDASSAFGTGLYTPEWDERTYAALCEEARQALRRGELVILDASFGRSQERERAFELARQWGVPAWFVHVSAPQAVTEARICARRDDASDADVEVHRAARQAWERSTLAVAARTLSVDADRPVSSMVQDVVDVLAVHGLMPTRL